MGSQVPQSGTSARIASMIFKVVAVLLILHATCGTYHTATAKQLSNADFTIDDTFDIDQFDEAPAANPNVLLTRNTRDLDTQSMLEDELQPVGAEEDAEANSSWLLKGVTRVRRELSRLFGKTEDKSAKQAHHRRKHNEGGKEVHHKQPKHKSHKSKRVNKHPQGNAQNTVKHLAKKHSKRQSDYDGSGDGDEDFGTTPLAIWRTQFIITEPWNVAYADHKSKEFLELHRQLEISFRELFQSTHNDEDFDISPTLLTVIQHNDSFKVYVIVQLELPEEVTDFNEVFANQIARYNRLGNLGVEADNRYYFRLVRDMNEPLDYGYDTPIEYDGEDGGVNGNDNGAEGGFDAEGNGEVIDENELPVTSNYQYDCDHNPDGEFQCSDGSLIACADHCNRYPDCPDGSDEEADLCQPIYEEEDRRQAEQDQRERAEEGQRQRADEERRLAEEEEARRRAEEEDEALRLAEREEDERRRAEEERRLYEEAEERRRMEKEREGEVSGSENQPQPNENDEEDERARAEQEEEERRRAEYEEEERRRAEEERIRAEQEEEERRRTEYEEERRHAEDERLRAEQEEEELRRAEDERLRAEYEEEERRRYEYERGRDPYEEPVDSETPIRPAQPDVTEVPEGVSHGSDVDEGSGDDMHDISTDRSTNFTPFGCRGDASFTCAESGVQICDEQRCDDHEDCPDGEDEIGCSEEEEDYEKVCAEYEFKCDERCLPREYLCNGAEECLDGSDEANCPTVEAKECSSNEYRCRAGNCIDSARRCDRVRDCPDGDDEDASCRCAANQFRCRNGDCVSGSAYCNGYRDCRDGSDEEDCSEPSYDAGRGCSVSQFRCSNGQCINAAARCDGYTDCADSSDELSCRVPDASPSNPQLNLRTYPDSQIIKESREVIFRCRDEGPVRARVKWTRPGGRPLPIGSRDNGDGRLEIPNIRSEDSGQYICEAAGYPRHVPGQQVTVHLTVEKSNPTNDRPPTACRANQATCRNNECIDKSQICDGIPHCSDGSDEESCSHGLKCQPNQFMCRNSRCIDRIWRCDGEDDCFDNSDEDSCDPEPSGAPCRYDEFQCRSGHCIPKNFQCDDTNDCIDGTDEIGCMAPAPIRPPPPYIRLQQGDPLNLTCVGTGVPVPLIVWRLNWGHVPEKCVAKSHAGTGTLYCPDMDTQDQGAYSCEILNSKGRNFVTPDTQVTVDAREHVDVCPAGFFNMLARRQDECINCFCFGISKSCKSANLYNFAIQPTIISHKVKNVELNPYSDIIINDAQSPDILSHHHGVQFRVSDVGYNSREQPYLALPNEYMGNQLKSYGGYLRYEVNYMGNGRLNQAPDVIMTGNGFTLTHRVRSQPEPNVNNKISVQFNSGNWYKTDGRRATREEIMMVLANVDNILIRLSYIDATEREVELTNIVMDSAGLDDQGLGSASLVEKCACPPGYVGDSCESCAPGYVREKYGPWLGRCVPFVPEPCQPGTYGDPGRGIPCRQCPCPQTGANNFASGCQLSPDGDVTCNCYEGYTGRRCEICAPGYQGNPLIPGGSCHRIPESTCNAEGTYYPHPNGTCECKPLVVGPRCDTCAPESFHLNAFTYTGCIECFCSGLTKQCSSSSWYRDQVSSNFGRSRAPHGFNLIRDYETSQPSQVSFQQANSALQFSQQSTSDPLYWSLPAPFLGDRITAYGGKLSYNLSYNPLPGGLMSRNNAPDVVIKSGEDLTIIHYRKAGVNPNQPSSYSVPIIESAWQRSDGQVVNREHLLMALSKIDAIYIKATYTTSTKDGQLTHVSLDIATQNNIGTQRAFEVEECRCPVGYIGLSCERCAPGYKRDTEAGLYLGVCEPCDCNGHSNQCDAETGVCMNCDHNTAGEFCERCAPGYNGNASGRTPYDCSPDSGPSPYPPPAPGNQTQCSYCNRDGTVSCDGGYCACKPNVVGPYCDQCRPGTYGLSERNPDGCEECYCSGKSSRCNSASLYRQLIPVDFISSQPLITDGEGNIVDTENLSFDLPTNMYTYSFTSYTEKYWSLRGSVLGNQLYSYGGHLSYALDVDSYGHYEPGTDVILIGNGMKLLWSRSSDEQEDTEYRVRLHEDENWLRNERGHSVRASRLDIMSVLANLEHILIRATPKIPTTRTSIRDVILESAVEHRTPDAQLAVEVEVCSCPAGYSGNSCEKCEPLHYKDSYGSCVACPCREDTTVGCSLQNNGEVLCQCRSGYSGQQCQIDDDYERPTQASPTPAPQPDYKTQITVSIAPPEITIIPIGGSLTLSCTGRMAWSGVPVFVSWSKLNGRLPYNAEEDGGVLRLYDLQIYDSGVYICRAVNNQTQRVFEDQISITITEDSQRTPSQIINLPQVISFEEYQPNEIYCEVNGHPTPTVTWTRVDGQMSLEAHTDGSRLIFDAPRKSDEGRYRCQATNEIGIDEKYTQVYVHIAPPQPPPPPRELVYIDPPSYTGETGDIVRLTCQPTTSILLVYEWNKDGYPVYRQRNVIISGNTIEIRESTPRDSGLYTCIGIDQRGRRNYTNDAQVVIEDSSYSVPGPQPGPLPGTIAPVVKRLPDENHIVQGQDFSITCEATGSPYPNIKWTKVHEALADNVQQTGNVLRIINARPENRGMYLCIAENVAGSHESNTIIDVEPRESPSVDIHPPEPQTVNVGTEAMLYCSATGIPDPSVQWRRVDGKPLSPRSKEISAGYIIIGNIQVEDSGDYECVAKNDVGRATGIQSVRVLVPPVITLEPSDEVLSLTEGDELKVVCTATGVPSPTVQWVDESTEFTRASLPTSPQYNEAFLEKYRIDRNDAKSYKCIASNEAGTAESYISVDVRPRRGDASNDSDVIRNPQYPYPYQPQPPPQYPPTRQPGYGPPQNIYRANEGDAVTLTCDLNNVPNLSTRWERVDGRPLPDNSYFERNSLIIKRVEEQNSGKYRCNALDNRGAVVTFVIAELVLVPIPHITFHPKMPILVAPNDNIDIYCEVTGEQPIDVAWHTDNNRPLTDSVRIDGQYLRFVSITPADAGRYYCSASNRYGNTTNMAEVVVNRNGAYQPAPRAQVYDIPEGEDVTLQCDVQSAREPIRGEIRYEWRRQDGRPLPRSALIRDQRLYLRGVLKQDEGRYVCESYSTGGGRSQSSFVDLNIKREYNPYPPPPNYGNEYKRRRRYNAQHRH